MKPSHILTAIVALLAGYWMGRTQASYRDVAPEVRQETSGKSAPVVSAGEGDSPTAPRKSRPEESAVPSGTKLPDELHKTFLIGNPITRSLRFAELLEGMTPQNAKKHS